MLDQQNRWRIKTGIANKLSSESIEFVFYQAEKRLEECNDISKAITNRTYAIISLIIALVSALIGFVVKYVIEEKDIPEFYFSAVILMIYLILTLIPLLSLIYPKKSKAIGSEPSKLLDEGFINKYQNRDMDKILILSEIQNYDYRIKCNSQKNNLRAEKLQKAMKLMIVFPIVAITVYLLCLFLVP